MRILHLMISLLLCCMLPGGCALAGGGQYYEYVADGFAVRCEKSVWDGLDKAYCEFDDVTELLCAAANALDGIAEQTGETDWLARYAPEADGRVHITIRSTEGASHTEGGYHSKDAPQPIVYMNITLLARGMAPLVHELTHVVCQDYGSLSLREGLAEYMNDVLSDTPTVFNYGFDPDVLCANVVLSDAANANLPELMGLFELDGTPAQTKQRSGYYLCSYSFTRYLISTYGMEDFMEMYAFPGGEKVYRLTTGKALSALQDDWLEYITQFEGQLTADENLAQLNALLTQHGFPADELIAD